jgi:Ca2+-binding RTX toxin-like protein
MATVGSAFDGQVSSAAYASFLAAISATGQSVETIVEDDRSATPGERVAGTEASDYIVLGLGDRLDKSGDASGGFDVVQTGAAVNLEGTGFQGVVLTGDKNIGATGGGEDNVIAGNSGNNVLKGGAGNDVIAGGDGNDRLDGGIGDDTLFGDAGDDVLLGGAGDDELHGGSGNDKLSGGDGNDSLYGDAGNDTLWGDAGNDMLAGGEGDDSLDGGLGNDSLFGDAGDDFLSGMAGDDVLFGGAGSDTLFGGAGHDTFVMGGDDQGDMDVISDFNALEDVIDLSGAGVANFDALTIEADGQDAIITLPDNTKFKLIGYSPDDVDSSFFHF